MCKFLDAILHISLDGVVVSAYHPNEMWIWTGKPAHKVKSSIPEFLGSRDKDVFKRARLDLLTRRLRGRQLGVAETAYLVAAGCIFDPWSGNHLVHERS